MSSRPQDSGPANLGWEEAAMNTLRHGASLSLVEKLRWLEEIEEVYLCMRRPGGSRDVAAAAPAPGVAEDGPIDPKRTSVT